jgi:hypothetical protein
MEAEQECKELYVDVYGVEYKKLRVVEEKSSGVKKMLITPNIVGCDVEWYVVDLDEFNINFRRK